MKSIIRSIVSSPKRVHYDKPLGLQYDLSYITSQIIVASAPVSGFLQQYYRYPLSDLVTFLNTYHLNHWRLFNFRGEDPGYTDEEVNGQVSHYPFPDHSPPSFDIMLQCVKELQQYLKQDTKNVAVLHCKAGKGRSGSLCCAYLMYDEFSNGRGFNVKSVIDLFTEKRMQSFAGDGISILSQQRYLDYWSTFLNSTPELRQQYLEYVEQVKPYEIYKVRVKNVCNLSEFYKLNLLLNTVAKFVKKLTAENSKMTKHDQNLFFTPNTPIKLDSSMLDIKLGVKTWCYCWFNIYFESLASSPSVILQWEDLDGFKGTRQRGVKVFDEIEVYWNIPQE
ncbi:protein tyrosine phosphatase [Spathaspora passalidarum NRRL Y-27907]|uniref:phosphatidylinositol-3,4,5-trisphosphate 3-phosphatase n=1 Tax=Spathaspora passalidarum (strain NRRL Y-27907 / 11-Y1) TaxID=619300 RepID=G3AUT8_SPAPN|nr:protein tyrosine phosphatase [Spathaspora passalidarum NRRL Y-27907]EGW30028.1 protein tyrosine phosphatase [Spathaspora passalidarum NRRL Y-27907]